MKLNKPAFSDLTDYKFFCFNGAPKYCQVIADRTTNETIDFFDMDWNHQEFYGLNPLSGPAATPQNFDEMKRLVKKLCLKDVPFLRVDLYNINNRIYFGELTFSPASGFGEFDPKEWDEKLGNLIKLPIGGVIKLSKPAFSDLTDYKFFCFNGVPTYCQIISDRSLEEKIDFYDMNWNRMLGMLGLSDKIRSSRFSLPCPKSFSLMKELATILSSNIPFSRIDFYEIDGNPYFGEITFFPASGFGRFSPMAWEHKLGDLIQLNKEKTE